jgi:hypothetical protein
MRIPSWLIVIAAVIAALPFAWGLGVLAAHLMLGPDVGVMPALTIPIALAGLIAVALSRALSPGTRFAIMAGGAAFFIILGALV